LDLSISNFSLFNSPSVAHFSEGWQLTKTALKPESVTGKAGKSLKNTGEVAGDAQAFTSVAVNV